MKIVHVITKAERGGAQVHVLGLIRHQLSSGLEVFLLVGDTGYLADEARRAGAEVIICEEIIHSIRPWHDYRATRQLARRLKTLSPDLVHAHSSKAGLLARLACRTTSIPCLFTAHGWAFSEGAPKKRRFVARLAESACAMLGHSIVNVSTYDRDLALRNNVGRAAQHRVIHNGLPDIQEYSAEGGLTNGAIVMVARFAAPKRQDLLIRALSLLPASVRLRLIGDGPHRAEYEALARQLGVMERVDFVGDSDEVARLLAEASMFVLLSDHEGLPLTIIEAMRTGLPVVASAVGGIPELVEDGATGMLLYETTPEVVADVLKSLLDNPARAKQMGLNGRERYLRYFTEQQMLKKLDAIYTEILVNS